MLHIVCKGIASRKRLLLGRILLLLCLGSVPWVVQASLASDAEGFHLITHQENADNKTINRRMLLTIYSMRTQTWPNGERLTVFVLPDNAALHRAFCRQVLGVLPYHLRRNWDRLIFSGRTSAPIEVGSVEEMKRRVAATPGSIGYVTQADLDDSILIVEVK